MFAVTVIYLTGSGGARGKGLGPERGARVTVRVTVLAGQARTLTRGIWNLPTTKYTYV